MENKSLNLLKAFSCLTVILLHCPLPGLAGEAIIYGLRFSVPSFFMITGYFSYGKNHHWLKKQMAKTLKLLISAELLCGAVRFILALDHNWNGIVNWLQQFPAFRHPVKTIFFGSFFNGTLWYLYALFWTLVLLDLSDTYIRNRTFAYRIAPLLLMFHILGRYLIQTYGNIDQYISVFCSAVFFGFPFVTAGRYVAEHQDRLSRYLTDRTCIVLLFSGAGIMVLEYLVWHTYMDLHLSTVFITFALFWQACSHPDRDDIPWLRIIGKKYSMWIYIFHFPCILLLNHIQANYLSGQFEGIFPWLKPAGVIFFSVLLSFLTETIIMQRQHGAATPKPQKGNEK